ncbi:hypothetical protein PG996_004882 [Apiospora saccharicola]|uniref:Secreted protein n=1 Tax=Apiospora saccharicola TaxID=335842 RepID=A0ABR1VJW3_9PEZI
MLPTDSLFVLLLLLRSHSIGPRAPPPQIIDLPLEDLDPRLVSAVLLAQLLDRPAQQNSLMIGFRQAALEMRNLLPLHAGQVPLPLHLLGARLPLLGQFSLPSLLFHHGHGQFARSLGLLEPGGALLEQGVLVPDLGLERTHVVLENNTILAALLDLVLELRDRLLFQVPRRPGVQRRPHRVLLPARDGLPVLHQSQGPLVLLALPGELLGRGLFLDLGRTEAGLQAGRGGDQVLVDLLQHPQLLGRGRLGPGLGLLAGFADGQLLALLARGQGGAQLADLALQRGAVGLDSHALGLGGVEAGPQVLDGPAFGMIRLLGLLPQLAVGGVQRLVLVLDGRLLLAQVPELFLDLFVVRGQLAVELPGFRELVGLGRVLVLELVVAGVVELEDGLVLVLGGQFGLIFVVVTGLTLTLLVPVLVVSAISIVVLVLVLVLLVVIIREPRPRQIHLLPLYHLNPQPLHRLPQRLERLLSPLGRLVDDGLQQRALELVRHALDLGRDHVPRHVDAVVVAQAVEELLHDAVLLEAFLLVGLDLLLGRGGPRGHEAEALDQGHFGGFDSSGSSIVVVVAKRVQQLLGEPSEPRLWLLRERLLRLGRRRRSRPLHAVVRRDDK